MISRTGNQPALDVDALLRHQQVPVYFVIPIYQASHPRFSRQSWVLEPTSLTPLLNVCVFHIPFMNSFKATLVLLKQKAGIVSAPPPHWYELPIWPKKLGASLSVLNL